MTAEVEYQREIAATIIAQIPGWLRAAVGFQFPAYTDTGVRFQVRGRSTYIVAVDYDRASDLYNVTVATKGKRSRVFHTAEQTDVQGMVDIIDRIDRGKLMPGVS